LRGKENLPLRTLGVFNLDDEKKKITVAADELELPAGKYLAWDVWNNRAIEFEESFSVEIAAHGSALYSIIPMNKQMQILDTDLKVTGIEQTTDGLQLTFAFAGKAIINYFDGNEIKSCEFESAAPGDMCIIKY
jgi:hypothetical protein